MTCKYYVFNLLDKFSYKKTNDILTTSGFENKGNLTNKYNYNMILYKKLPKVNTFDTFVIYIKEPNINPKFINSIRENIYDEFIDAKKILGNKTFYLYFIIDTDKMTPELKKFIRDGATSVKFCGKYWAGKIQIPIIIDSTEKKLYVGYYNKSLYLGPGMLYKKLFDILFEKMKLYYKEKNIEKNYKIVKFKSAEISEDLVHIIYFLLLLLIIILIWQYL